MILLNQRTIFYTNDLQYTQTKKYIHNLQIILIWDLGYEKKCVQKT